MSSEMVGATPKSAPTRPHVRAAIDESESVRADWQREFARAFGVLPGDDDDLRRVFVYGVETVGELELSEPVSRKLLTALATLYAEALVSRWSTHVFGSHRPAIPDYALWLIPGHDK